MEYLKKVDLAQPTMHYIDPPYVAFFDDGKETAGMRIRVYNQTAHIHMLDRFDRSLWIEKVRILKDTLEGHIRMTKAQVKRDILSGNKKGLEDPYCIRQWLNPPTTGGLGNVASYLGRLYKDDFYDQYTFSNDYVFSVASCHEAVRFQISNKNEYTYMMGVMEAFHKALVEYYSYLKNSGASK